MFAQELFIWHVPSLSKFHKNGNSLLLLSRTASMETEIRDAEELPSTFFR